MKDMRPFEGIITEQVSDQLSDQTRLSILSRNARLKRGKVTNNAVDSYNVILLQEAESHSTRSQNLLRNSSTSIKARTRSSCFT